MAEADITVRVDADVTSRLSYSGAFALLLDEIARLRERVEALERRAAKRPAQSETPPAR